MKNLRLLVLAAAISGFSGCAEIKPQTGTQLSCSDFARQADGTWQGSANATATIDGATAPAAGKFGRNGPLVGGVNLYNVLQNQCGKS